MASGIPHRAKTLANSPFSPGARRTKQLLDGLLNDLLDDQSAQRAGGVSATRDSGIPQGAQHRTVKDYHIPPYGGAKRQPTAPVPTYPLRAFGKRRRIYLHTQGLLPPHTLPAQWRGSSAPQDMGFLQ